MLLNDPQFVEASRVLAERMFRAGATPAERIECGFRRLTGRRPTDDERGRLEALYADERAAFARDGRAGRALLSVGARPADPTLPVADAAALTVVASTVMNLDAAVFER